MFDKAQTTRQKLRKLRNGNALMYPENRRQRGPG